MIPSLSFSTFLPFLFVLLLTHPIHAVTDRARDATDSTIAEVLLSSGSILDNATGDFDVFTHLLKDSFLIQLLSMPQNRFTIFAPNDDAMIQTARDIAIGLSLSPPSDEKLAYRIITSFLKRYPVKPGDIPILKYVLQFHILPVSLASEDILSETSFTTLNGFNISRFGLKLSTDQLQGHPVSNFEKASIIAFHAAEIRAKNGYIHTIDRLLFPPMPNLTILPQPSDEAGTSPEPSAEPTMTPLTSPSTISTITPTLAPVPSITAPFSSIPIPCVDPGPKTQTPPVPSSSPRPRSPTNPTEPVSPSRAASRGNSCFPASAVIHLSSGKRIAMANLTAGTAIAASEQIHSPVYLFTHRIPHGYRYFVRLHCSNGRAISLSPEHYIYANGKLIAARLVSVGDMLRTVSGLDSVTRVERTRERGLYAPHTIHGDIVVNGIVASTYTEAVHPKLAHAVLWPLRLLVRYGGFVEPIGSLLYHGFPWNVGHFLGRPTIY